MMKKWALEDWTPEMRRLCDAETKRRRLKWRCYDYHPDEGPCAACAAKREDESAVRSEAKETPHV